MARLRPFVGKTVGWTVFCSAPFPKDHGKPRIGERPVLGGTIFPDRNGWRWSDAPAEHGLPKTPCNRRQRWR